MAALRQPPNLRRILCRSYLYSVKRGDKFERSSKKSAPGWHKCGKNCCICPFTSKNTTKVTAHITGYTHEIRQAVNCETANCIYYWKCIKDNCNQFPQCEYIGLTTRSFKKRFSEHKGYIKSEDTNQPSGNHFNLPGHQLSHMQGLVLEKVTNSDPFVLRVRESKLIQQFDTFKNGLNKEP